MKGKIIPHSTPQMCRYDIRSLSAVDLIPCRLQGVKRLLAILVAWHAKPLQARHLVEIHWTCRIQYVQINLQRYSNTDDISCFFFFIFHHISTDFNGMFILTNSCSPHPEMASSGHHISAEDG